MKQQILKTQRLERDRIVRNSRKNLVFGNLGTGLTLYFAVQIECRTQCSEITQDCKIVTAGS